MASNTAQDQLSAFQITCDECSKHDRLWDYKGRFLCEECLFVAEESECDCHREG